MRSTRKCTSGSTSTSTTSAGHPPRIRQRHANRFSANCWTTTGFQRTQCSSSTTNHAKGSWWTGSSWAYRSTCGWIDFIPRHSCTYKMKEASLQDDLTHIRKR